MDLPAPKGEGAAGPAPTASLSSWLARLVDVVSAHLFSWGLVTVLIGLSPGLAIWPLLNYEHIDFVATGALDQDLRLEVMESMALSLGCTLVLYGLVFLWLRRGKKTLTFADVAHELNRFCAVICALPLLTTLMHQGIESDHQFITLTIMAVITGIMATFVHRVLALRPSVPAHLERQPDPVWPSSVVWGLFAFYAVYMGSLALLDHRNLGTHVFDLGIYDNIFWHNAQGEFMGCSFCKTGRHMSSHFDPILYLLSPIYRLNPRAETILVLQATWLAVGVFPLYLIGRRRLQNPWLGVILSAIYVFYPALHGVNMFDFHSLTLVVPTLMWVIYFVDSGAQWRYWLFLGLMLLTREDMSLLACFIGAYAILKRRPITGLVTIVVALSYLMVVKGYVMNDPGLIMAKSKESTSFHYFYKEMIPHEDEGAKGLLITLLTNPVYALQVVLKQDKVFFFLALFGPLLFLPLASGPKVVMMAYGFLFIGAASRKYVFSLYFQYSSVLFPILLTALPDGIDRVSRSRALHALGFKQRRLVWTLMWTCFVATLMVTHKYGAFWPNDAFRAGWNHLARGENPEREERYEYVQQLIREHIPSDASVSASSALGPHVSNRKNISKWPITKSADYLLIFSDSLNRKNRERMDRLVAQGTYRKIDEMHGIVLYQRIPRLLPLDPLLPGTHPIEDDFAEPDGGGAFDGDNAGGGDPDDPRNEFDGPARPG